jgi:hypothetical protein
VGQTIHKDWDINKHVTGRFKDGKPIIGVTFQNGLNRKKNGLFLPVNTTVFAQNDYEFTHKVDEARAILRFGDSSSNSKKHLFGIEDDEGNWLNVKLDHIGHEMSGVFGNKPTFPHTDGLTVEHIPKYNGIKTNYRLGSSGINEITVTFKHNRELSPEQRGNTIVFTRDGRDIFFVKAPFAYDDGKETGHIEPVVMKLTETGGFSSATLTVDSLWVAGAIDPVIDPDVTIDDVTGTINDNSLVLNNPTFNYGGAPFMACQRQPGTVTNNLISVDLSLYPDITIINSKFGLDFYSVVGGSNTFDYYKVLVDWVEGTASGGSQVGSSDWTYRIRATNSWNSAGCEGIGTDHAAVKDGSVTVSEVDSDFPMPLTNALTQDWIDNPGNNKGIVWIKPVTESGVYSVAYSSESGTGNKPYFYMEHIEEVVGNPYYYYAQQ